MIERPAPSECAPFYRGYVEAVPEGDVLATLEEQTAAAARLLKGIDPEKEEHRYAPGKWSVKEVAAHVIDTERIFACRALRLARGDRTPLPGFDQDAYVAALDLSERTLSDLADELLRVRASTLDLFRSFGEEELRRSGQVSGRAISVRAIVYIVAGHERHHRRILEERYL